MGEDGHEVLVHGGEGFVLAALAGELPDEGLAGVLEDGVEDGIGGFELVGAEVDAPEVGGEGAEGGDDGVDLGGL
jgi:hypothetical protein